MPPKRPIPDTLLWAYVHDEASPEERDDVDAACTDPAVARRLTEIQELHHLLTSAAQLSPPTETGSNDAHTDPDDTTSPQPPTERG